MSHTTTTEDLYDDESTTTEQRFMLMLLERIDCLCDSVHKIENQIEAIKRNIPIIEEDYSHIFKNVYISNDDASIRSKSLYFRIYYLAKNTNESKIKEFLKNIDYISHFLSYDASSVDFGIYFEEEDHTKDFRVLQCLVNFNTHIYAGHFILELYKAFADSLHICAKSKRSIYICSSHNEIVSVYYELTITAGRCDIPLTQAKDMNLLIVEGDTTITRHYALDIKKLKNNDIVSRYCIKLKPNSHLGLVNYFTPTVVIALLPNRLLC